MKMKKVISVLLVLVMAFSFAACNKKKAEPKKKNEAEAVNLITSDKKLYKYAKMIQNNNFMVQTYYDDKNNGQTLVTCTYQEGYYYFYIDSNDTGYLETPEGKRYLVSQKRASYVELTDAVISKYNLTEYVAAFKKFLAYTYGIAFTFQYLYPTDVTLNDDTYVTEAYINNDSREYYVFFYDANDSIVAYSVQSLDDQSKDPNTVSCTFSTPTPETGKFQTMLSTFQEVDASSVVG